MSEMGNAAAAAGGANGVDTKPPVGGTEGGNGADPRPIDDLLPDDSAPAAPQTWPDDWRERVSGGDENALKALRRFSDPAGLWKKIANQEKLLSDRAGHKAVPTLAEDATEEEIAAYRKATGIPDTPEGYGLTFAEEFGATEADNAVLQAFLSDAHAGHKRPDDAKWVVDWYQNFARTQREAQIAAAQEAKTETQVALRGEYGAELKRNLTITDEFLGAHSLTDLLHAVLPSGRQVLHDPAAMKSLITMARQYADEDAVYKGDAGGGGKSLDDRINELRAKSVDGKISKTEDEELNKLYEMRVQRDARPGRRAA